MQRTIGTILIGSAAVLASTTARADVLVRLHSGAEYRAERYWVEDGVVNFPQQSGVMGFPQDAVAEIKEVVPEAASAGTAAANGTASGGGAAVKSGPRGEDLATRQDRLDRESVRALKDLSIARHRDEPEGKLEELKAKLDSINRERAENLKKLKSIH